MNKSRKKKGKVLQTEGEVRLKNFLDMIAPSVTHFYTDYYICGNTYRSVWALKEYPTATDKAIRGLFDEEKIDEMLEYIQIYATSVASPDEKDKSSKKALELYQYLNNNKEGLLAYDKRGMKHRRMRWSVNGANNLAKVLYRKENKELIETIDRYTDGLVFTMQMQEIVETLSAAKAPKKDGKGNPYADRFNHHMPLFEAMQTASRKAFKRAFGY